MTACILYWVGMGMLKEGTENGIINRLVEDIFGYFLCINLTPQ